MGEWHDGPVSDGGTDPLRAATPEPQAAPPSSEPTAEQQIAALAQVIMEEIPGEPSRSEGAVECAVRLLREAYTWGVPREAAPPAAAPGLVERLEAIGGLLLASDLPDGVVQDARSTLRKAAAALRAAEPQPAPPSSEHICQTGDCGLEPCVDLPVHRVMPGGRGVRTQRPAPPDTGREGT
jgi:hypothetical protein